MEQRSTNGTPALRGVTWGSTPSVIVASTEKARFGAYFPRVFACAYALTGDEDVAKNIVAETFSYALVHSKDLSEEEFVVELFGRARELIRAAPFAVSTLDKLTARERELLAFVFDARLSHEEIRRLMRTTERALSAALLGALRKLRSEMRPAAGNALRPA